MRLKKNRDDEFAYFEHRDGRVHILKWKPRGISAVRLSGIHLP